MLDQFYLDWSILITSVDVFFGFGKFWSISIKNGMNRFVTNYSEKDQNRPSRPNFLYLSMLVNFGIVVNFHRLQLIWFVSIWSISSISFKLSILQATKQLFELQVVRIANRICFKSSGPLSMSLIFFCLRPNPKRFLCVEKLQFCLHFWRVEGSAQ